jgi:hypothetical protein
MLSRLPFADPDGKSDASPELAGFRILRGASRSTLHLQCCSFKASDRRHRNELTPSVSPLFFPFFAAAS